MGGLQEVPRKWFTEKEQKESVAEPAVFEAPQTQVCVHLCAVIITPSEEYPWGWNRTWAWVDPPPANPTGDCDLGKGWLSPSPECITFYWR